MSIRTTLIACTVALGLIGSPAAHAGYFKDLTKKASFANTPKGEDFGKSRVKTNAFRPISRSEPRSKAISPFRAFKNEVRKFVSNSSSKFAASRMSLFARIGATRMNIATLVGRNRTGYSNVVQHFINKFEPTVRAPSFSFAMNSPSFSFQNRF